MRVVGTLVFTVGVIINSIVCPGLPQKPRKEVPSLRVVRMSAADLPGVWSLYETKRSQLLRFEHFPVRDYLDVVVKGNTIIGRDHNNKLYPIYNEEGRDYITMEFGRPARTPKVLLSRDAERLGMFQVLPENTIKPERSSSRNQSCLSKTLTRSGIKKNSME